MVKMQCWNIPNWNSPGEDYVQGYWLKNLTSLHSHIAGQLNHICDREKPWPDWVAFGKTVLCQKDPAKGSAVDSQKPLLFLPLMWKLMTGILAEKMYSHLEKENVLPFEQKGYCKVSCEIKGQLFIDITVSRDCKRRPLIKLRNI